MDVGKEVVYGRASGEQIPNRHDDDQSVETSQMGNGLGETEAVSDGALREPIKNRDDNKSVYEIAETGNNIREKESDVGKEVVYGGASGEQIPNPNDDDQSLDETSQMGNGLGETEAVSDGSLREPIKNRDDNKSVYEIAETGNNIGEKESDVGKELVYGGASGEQIPNPNDYDQSLDETSQMGNGLCETEAVSDDALAEPMKDRDNKSVDEAAETGNSIRENESDVGKEVVFGGASGEQIPNLHDDDQSVHDTTQMGNGLEETEGVSDGALAEPMKNRDHNKNVYEIAKTGNSIGEKESDVGKEVVYDGASGEQIPNPHDYDQSVYETSQTGNGVLETERVSDRAPAEPIQNRNDKISLDETAKKGNNSGAEKESDAVKQGQHITHSDHDKSPDETAEMANGVCEKTVELEGDLVKQGMTYDGESGEQTKNCDDRENIDESKANLDAKSEMTDRENLFSDIDSDVENQTDGDTDLTDIINTLADEIIKTLAEETVSKYYGIEGNEKKEGQTRNPPLESSDKLHKVNSSDVESEEEDNLSLAKLKALNELKHTLRESTPMSMSMEEYRLRNQEELDAKTIHKKCVKALTGSIISDKSASVHSDSDVSATGLKSDTTFSNGMESDSSEEWTIITRKKNKGKKSKK